MSRLNSFLRAGGAGGVFLGLAVWAAVASNTSGVPVVAGLAVGLALLLVGMRSGQVIPGGRTERPPRASTGATVGVAIAVVASSVLSVFNGEIAKTIAIGWLALIAGFVLGFIPVLWMPGSSSRQRMTGRPKTGSLIDSERRSTRS